MDTNKDNLKNKNIDIDIAMVILENIDMDIGIDFLENIDNIIDIDKGIWQNIDIDKISYRLEFGISNRATLGSVRMQYSLMMFAYLIFVADDTDIVREEMFII